MLYSELGSTMDSRSDAIPERRRIGGGLTYRLGVELIHGLWVGVEVGVGHGCGLGLGHGLEIGVELGFGLRVGVRLRVRQVGATDSHYREDMSWHAFCC